jgi:outer membrane protein
MTAWTVGTSLVVVACCLAISLGLAQTSAAPPPQQPESLPLLTIEDATRIALQKHPSIQKADAVIEAAEAQVRQVRASYFPQLSLSAIGKVGLSGATGALGLPGFPGSPFFRNVATSTNWYQNIFDFGRTRHLVAASRAGVEAERFSKLAQEAQITFAVRRAYLTVMEAERLQEVAKETVEERQLTLNQSQAYFRAQLRSKLDVALAQANLAEAQGSLVQAQSAVHTAFAGLAAAMGVDALENLYRLQEPEAEFPEFPPLDQLVQNGLPSRPETRALDLKVQAFAEKLGLAKSDRLPEIRGFAAAGEARFEGTSVKPEQRHGVGALGVIVPVFTGGRLKGERDEAEANLKGAIADRTALHQQIQLQITQAYYQSLNSKDRICAAADQERAAQDALRLAQARFKMNLASFLELTTAEVAATRAEAAEAQTIYDFERALAELELASAQKLTRPLNSSPPGSEAPMRSKTLPCLVAALSLLAAPTNAQTTKSFETGRILAVEKHEPEGFYAGNPSDAPLESNVVEYRVSVQVRDTIYVGSYQTPTGYLPTTWVKNHPAEVRIERHVMYLKSLLGEEVRLPIVSRKRSKEPLKEGPPTPRGQKP